MWCVLFICFFYFCIIDTYLIQHILQEDVTFMNDDGDNDRDDDEEDKKRMMRKMITDEVIGMPRDFFDLLLI